MKADFPRDEDSRLDALYDLAILDSEREQSYDDIAQLALHICQVPIAVVSLVDKERQWFKTCLGLDARETHRDVAFCAHAILNPNDVLEVEDATQDYRFFDNPLVTGDPGIRFYAGAPLVTGKGYALGTLCIIDQKPKKLSIEQKSSLVLLANQVVKLLELRESHQKISEQAEKFSTLYEMAPVAIALNRVSDGVFLDANPEFYRMLGYTPAEFSGLSYWDITPKDYAEQEKLQLQRLVDCHRYGPYEKHYISKYGNLIPVCLNGVLITSPQGEEQIWSVIEDNTERKKAERLKDEFISTVSHELRTPLTSISAALRMVTAGMLGELPQKIYEVLLLAEKNSRRLSLLINDLLDMEKLSAGKMEFQLEPSPILSLITESIASNQSYADQYQVKFQLNAPIDDVELLIDKARFQQVMSNFLSNAAKFSEKNSSVEIELSILDQYLRIAVKDHGIGIPLEFQSRIFQKFAQADSSDSRRRGGTGLGLSITKELVERMNGRVGFYSVVNQGTCFFAEFPLLIHQLENEND